MSKETSGINEALLIYTMFKDKSFFDGVKSSVDYLSQSGNSIGTLHKIVNEVEQNKDKFEEKYGK
jgi:hypothetical protein